MAASEKFGTAAESTTKLQKNKVCQNILFMRENFLNKKQ